MALIWRASPSPAMPRDWRRVPRTDVAAAASRVPEAARGLAVVASEVKFLASQTAMATVDTSEQNCLPIRCVASYKMHPSACGSTQSRFGGEMAQRCEAHDGSCGKFLCQFHAIVVDRAVSIVEIDRCSRTRLHRCDGRRKSQSPGSRRSQATAHRARRRREADGTA